MIINCSTRGAILHQPLPLKKRKKNPFREDGGNGQQKLQKFLQVEKSRVAIGAVNIGIA